MYGGSKYKVDDNQIPEGALNQKSKCYDTRGKYKLKVHILNMSQPCCSFSWHSFRYSPFRLAVHSNDCSSQSLNDAKPSMNFAPIITSSAKTATGAAVRITVFDPFVQSNQLIALEANYNICTGSGSCINTPGIIGGVVVFIALVLISIGVRAARAKKLAAANLALTNQGVSMQPTNINRDATAPQSTNQASSGLVTLVK